MRAVGMGAAGAVIGWFGGLAVVVVVRLLTGGLMASPVTLRGLEIGLSVAGIIGGALWGAREDRRVEAERRAAGRR